MKRAILVLKQAIIPEGLTGVFYGVDQGALVCLQANKRIKAAIGDFDSVSEEEKQAIFNNSEQIIQLNTHKDLSDTAEALALVSDERFDEILVLGGLSGRFDHTWANLQLLQRYPHIIWMDQKNRLTVLQPGTHVIFKKDYSYVSFFSFSTGEITLQGMAYPLHQYVMEPLDSLGLSNEILKEQGTVHCTMPVLCVQSKD